MQLSLSKRALTTEWQPTKLYTTMVANTGQPLLMSERLAEPMFVSSTAVVRIVCTPSAVTSFTWIGNFGGYEK